MAKVKGRDEWARDLTSLVDRKDFHEELGEKHSYELATALASSAAFGLGPGDRQFAPYSKSYLKQLKRKGKLAKKRFLVGPDRVGNDPDAMLSRGTGRKQTGTEHGRFGFYVKANGNAALTWKGKDADQDVYGLVHQGTELGGRTHTKGHVPPRPWMHLATSRSAKAVEEIYEATHKARVARFNAKKAV